MQLSLCVIAKPANVMIGRYGEVVLMDWGIARKLRGDASPSAPASGQQPTVKNPASSQPTEESRKRQFLTRNDHLIGTPAYMSPEQATGHNDKIDERSDIYSAAVVFHELLGLRHYLANHENLHSLLLAIASEPFPYMKLVFMRNPKFPVPRSEFLHFVARGLAKNPDDRFQSVIEMLGELQQIIDGRCHVRCPATLAKRSLREVAGFVDRFPKLSPFVFYSLVIFMFYSVGLTLYSLLR